jgi:uncharacterized protein (DUF1697 family)
MTNYIALLRGINVSGANKVPMTDLRAMLVGLGFENVQTCIQSGNAVFGAAHEQGVLQGLIEAAFVERFGFAVPIIAISSEALTAAIAANPFAHALDDPAKLHLGFMAAEPSAEAVALLKTKPHSGEVWQIFGKNFYFHTPAGMGTSKLFPYIERTLKVAVTFRNWRTVEALRGMISSV